MQHSSRRGRAGFHLQILSRVATYSSVLTMREAKQARKLTHGLEKHGSNPVPVHTTCGEPSACPLKFGISARFTEIVHSQLGS